MKKAYARRIQIAIVLLIIGSIGLLRFSIASSDFLWLDELHTSWSVDSDLSSVTSRAKLGNQTPLYFWLTWSITQTTGQSHISLRLVSVLSGLLIAILGTAFTWKVTRSILAATAFSLIIALDVWSTFYGTEARPYALLELLGLVHFALFLDWMGIVELSLAKVRQTRKTFWLATFCFVSIALIYCHIIAIWLFIAEFLLLAVFFGVPAIRKRLRPHESLNPKRIALASLIVFFGCVPIFSQMLDLFGRRQNWSTVSDPSVLAIDSAWPIFSLLVLPLGAVLFSRIVNRNTTIETSAERNRYSSFATLSALLAWGTVPILGCIIVELAGIAPMALHRYTIVGALAIPLFAAFCIAAIPTRRSRIVLMTLVVISCLIEIQPRQGVQLNPLVADLLIQRRVPRLRFENWRDVVRDINEDNLDSQMPVFLFSNLVEDGDALTSDDFVYINYLRFPVRGIHDLDIPDADVIPGPTLSYPRFQASAVEKIRQSRGGWIIVRGTPDLMLEICEELRRALGESNEQSNEERPQKVGQDSVKIRLGQYPFSHVYVASIEP